MRNASGSPTGATAGEDIKHKKQKAGGWAESNLSISISPLCDVVLWRDVDSVSAHHRMIYRLVQKLHKP